MNISKISIQNIKSKPLYTFLSVFILMLSIALLLAIQQIKSSFKYQMENNLAGVDLVVGAKGSPLQLILASILHIDNPTGNISYKEAKKISKNRMVKKAVPISYGDNYKGYRIVGTTNEFITLYLASIKEGRLVKKSMEVVLGSTVAKQLDLKIGDTFLSSHGLIENDVHVHEEKLTVVGILTPTKKVIDRLIITNLESVWDVHHHHEKDENVAEHHDEAHHHKITEEEHHKHNEDEAHEGHHHQKGEECLAKHHEDSEEEHHHDHDDEKEITSLLISFKNPRALLTFPRKINKQTNMQASLPKYELDRLQEFTGVGIKTISLIAYLILAISCMIIFISLYKMVKERAFDLAILRTYGATNFQLIKMVAYEGFIIASIAFLLGIIFSKIGMYFMLKIAETKYLQSVLQQVSFKEIAQTGILVFVTIVLSVSIAIYPIIKMNISTILSNEK